MADKRPMMILKTLARKAMPGPVRSLRSLIQLGRYAEQWIVPRPATRRDDWVPQHEVGHAGFSLFPDELMHRVRRWRDEYYQSLFNRLREDESINVPFAWGDYRNKPALHNGYYPTPDAEVYAAMILETRPARIVEVGSGYSTRVARMAVRYAELGTSVTVIDPEPRADVQEFASEVYRSFVEDLDLSSVDLQAGDILFIDSSHICRARGDLPVLFCKLLPSLPAGVLVHVHDIYLPYDYPTSYDQFCYHEQYMLHCSLQSRRYHTAFATHWMSRHHGDEMRQTFGPLVGVDPLLYGASYWFRVEP